MDEQSKTITNEAKWQRALRAFHLTGRVVLGEPEPSSGKSLWPALAAQLATDNFDGQYPVILPASADQDDQSVHVSFGPDTLPLLYSWEVSSQRSEILSRSHREIEELIAELESLLLHQNGGRNPQALAKTMGAEANVFVDLEKLARNLPSVGGAAGDFDARAMLIGDTLAVLRSHLAADSRSTPFYLFSRDEIEPFPEIPTESRFVTKNCFEDALKFANELLERMTRLFRAVRIARLLVSGRYQPQIHDEIFSRFEWQSCNQAELLLVPKIVAVDSSVNVKEKGHQNSLSRLLRSGRPVQILITQDQTEFADADLGTTLEDLATIALAHRDAFVLQSTVVQPDHLLPGLRQMVQSVLPSIAFVSICSGSQDVGEAWAAGMVSHYGRIAPCFRYTPDRGPSWTDRLDLSGNPQPESVRAIVSLESASGLSTSKTIHETATFAHAAALRPEFRHHFRVIPDQAWSDDQEPIGNYLEKYKSNPPNSLPYIWILLDGQLGRAIVTREMVNACRDRFFAWRSLQELAGIGSKQNLKLDEEKIQKELEVRYQIETETARAAGRAEGAEQAVKRIVAALFGDE